MKTPCVVNGSITFLKRVLVERIPLKWRRVATTLTLRLVHDGNNANVYNNKQLVIDELLSFVAYKLNWMTPGTVIQLCTSFYSDEAVDSAKAKLYELCADSSDRQDRFIKRSGVNKEKNNLEDIVSLMMWKNDSLSVTFVTTVLANLPAVSFNSIDLMTLLAKIETIKVEIAM